MVLNAVDAINQYIADCQHRNLAAKTLSGYRWALSILSDKGRKLPSSSSELLRVLDVPGFADDTRHDLWRAARTFYRWLERTHGESNLMDDVPPPRKRRRLPRALNDNEVQALLDAAKRPRDLALLAIMLDTGVRVGEAAGLTRSTISPEGMDVFGKTGGRFVPLSKSVYEMITSTGNGELIWIGVRGQPLTTNGLTQIVRRTMRQANLRPPKTGPHTLRHTFARRFLRLGGNLYALQRLLGHASIESTMVYAHMADRELMDQHRRYSPLQGFELGKVAQLRRV